MPPIKCFLVERVVEGESFSWLRVDTGERYESTQDIPVGAVYRATWYEKCAGWCGADGKAYICVIPDKSDGTGTHFWHIDHRCNNCTLPDDNVHKCWVRHGEAPNFHVDKNGVTCSAGAGSILTHNGFHGFLHNGFIVSC